MNQEILKHIEQALALAKKDHEQAENDYEQAAKEAEINSLENYDFDIEAVDAGVYDDAVKKQAEMVDCPRVVEKLEKLLSDLC